VEAQPVGMAFGHDDSYIDIFDGVAITRHYLATKDVVDQMCTTLLIRNFTPDEWSSFLPGNNYRRTCPNLP
jgi:hypothetical protein